MEDHGGNAAAHEQIQRRRDVVMSQFPTNIDRPTLLNSTPPTNNSNQQIHPLITNNNQIQIQIPQNQQTALQLAYHDAWRVCHPDFKRPFSNLEDACDRLLPFHVVADYEAEEEDDKILESDTTGEVLSRSQQWDRNVAVKLSEFTVTFEKQVRAFNIISRKRDLGEFRTEEKLMMEQLLLENQKRALLELRATRMEDLRQKTTQEANMRQMAAMEQAQGAIRANAVGPRGGFGGINMGEQGQDQDFRPEETFNGWLTNAQKDDKEPLEDFLNDEETVLQGDWRGGREFDLNAR